MRIMFDHGTQDLGCQDLGCQDLRSVPVRTRQDQSGMARSDQSWHGSTSLCMILYKVLYCMGQGLGLWPRRIWHGQGGYGMARSDMAWPGHTRHGTTPCHATLGTPTHRPVQYVRGMTGSAGTDKRVLWAHKWTQTSLKWPLKSI